MKIRMIQASVNRGSRLGAKTSVQGKFGSRLGPENFTSVFQKQGEILVLKKMLNFLSFLVLLYLSGHFKQKNQFFHQTDRKKLSKIVKILISCQGWVKKAK